jgi:GAF domain-containing protein
MPTNRHSKKPDTKNFRAHLKRPDNIFQQHQEKYELIQKITQAILRVTDSLDEVFELIRNEGITKTSSDSGQIILLRHSNLEVIKEFPKPSSERPEIPKSSVCYKAIHDRQNKNIGDVKDSSRYPEIKEGFYNPINHDTKSELAVLIRPENSRRILGVLNFERKKKGEFTEDEVEWAKLLAGQAAIAIRQSQLWEGIQTLNQITISLASAELTPETAFQEIVSKIVEWTDCEQCYILQKDENEFLVLGSNARSDMSIRITQQSLVGHVFSETPKPEMFKQSELQATNFKNFGGNTKNRIIQSVLMIPLIDHQDENMVGALYLDDSRINHFSQFEIELLKAIAGIISKTLSATSRMVAKSQDELIAKAKDILSQLDLVKDNFTHRYGSNIGDSRGKLLELKDFLSGFDLPNVPRREKTVPDFIDWIVDNLYKQKEELLKFSKEFDTKHIVENTLPMDLLQIAKTHFQCAKKKISKIEFDFVDNLPPMIEEGIYISSFCKLNQLISDVIENLVENAVQSINKVGTAHRGQITFTVAIPIPHHISLEIKDNGVGISKDTMPKIFNGYSSKTEPDFHGNGLAFCRLYIWAHGGIIDVKSEVGKGAAFSITFPTIQDPGINKTN